MVREYITWHQGPAFKVVVSQQRIEVYKGTDTDNINTYTVLVLTIKDYYKVFIGKDPSEPQLDGNSILVQASARKYVFIGAEIYSFITRDTIISYVGQVGNGGWVYPYAIGKKYIYLLIEHVKIPTVLIDSSIDPYDWYYYQDNKKQGISYKIILIHKRR